MKKNKISEIIRQDEKKPIKETLRRLLAREVTSFPVIRMPSVKSTVTALHIAEEGKFKTHRNKFNKTIEVTRLA